MKIIETDNFGGDYPDEKFLNLPPLREEHARKIADAINGAFPECHRRYWRVVADDYKLLPGFEP
jgi:hypothetical protein